METKRDPPAEGANALFAFDRARLDRFRSTFPRARWNDEEKRWFVPGKTAEQRLARWLDTEADLEGAHGEARGRDAFAFDPIDSPYLTAGEDIVIRTPFSRTVVQELRHVPYASWDDAEKAWRVPYAGFEELRRRWPVIEAAARRNEPDAKRARAQASKDTEEHRAAQALAAERKRRRHPLDAEDLPPLDEPVATTAYGIVIFTRITGELVDHDLVARFYPALLNSARDLVWGEWRLASLEELVRTWPARQPPSENDRLSGWWMPTKPELVDARRKARSREKRQARD